MGTYKQVRIDADLDNRSTKKLETILEAFALLSGPLDWPGVQDLRECLSQLFRTMPRLTIEDDVESSRAIRDRSRTPSHADAFGALTP